MRKKKVGAIAIKSFALLVALGTAYRALLDLALAPRVAHSSPVLA
jgi:hypothetical protein